MDFFTVIQPIVLPFTMIVSLFVSWQSPNLSVKVISFLTFIAVLCFISFYTALLVSLITVIIKGKKLLNDISAIAFALSD